jgi:3-oxoacyl-[acyl-carrier protein] reductase
MTAPVSRLGDHDLGGRVVLVTGAGGGFGGALAVAAAACRGSVAVNDIDGAAARKTSERIRDRGGRAMAVPADITDAESVRAMVAAVAGELGPIDVLANCAGITSFEAEGTFLGLEQWRRILGVNLDGTWNCCSHVLPGMLARRSGSIVNVSSIATESLIGSSTAYIASKGAVEYVTKALARRVAPNVRVNAIAPGSMETSWYAHYYNVPDANPPGEYVPMDHVIALTLALMANPSVTGQVVMVDAGERFRPS